MQTETMSHPLGIVDADALEGRSKAGRLRRDSAADDDEIHASFGRRLRAVRERQRIPISAIAESTKILGALLEGLENDDVSRWPTGLYRRAFIRAYARAIGLDPEPVVREFVARFPDPEDALPPPPVPLMRAPRAVLRLTLAEPGGLSHATIGRAVGRRLLAIAFDVGMVTLLGAGMFAVLGVTWLPVAVVTMVYYVAATLVLGTTPGVRLASSSERPTATDRTRFSSPPQWSVRTSMREWTERMRRRVAALMSR